jgi:hypothetical protein
MSLFCCVSFAALLTGCSEEPSLTIANAEGILKINGQPADGVMIQFLPDAASGKNCPTSSGSTDEDGRFSLKLADGRDGAVVGKCRVTLVDVNQAPRYGNQDDAEPLVNARKPLPSSYAIPNPNGLTVEVKEDGSPIEIDVKVD